MKVSMAKQKAQKGSIRDQIMNDWKSGRIDADTAQQRMKEAGV